MYPALELSLPMNTCGPLSIGHLPDPENVTLISQNSSTSELQWKPPYYTINQESDIIHVDPMITQYTVCTIDAYTSRMIGSMNTTVTSFTLNTVSENLVENCDRLRNYDLCSASKENNGNSKT